MSVSGVSDLNEIVSIDGAGTSATVTNANVANIAQPATAADAWRAFVANNGATMSISDSTISDVVGSRVLFNSLANSEITVDRVDVVNAVGAQVLVRIFQACVKQCVYGC